jgi:hypothetical protein
LILLAEQAEPVPQVLLAVQEPELVEHPDRLVLQEEQAQFEEQERPGELAQLAALVELVVWVV